MIHFKSVDNKKVISRFYVFTAAVLILKIVLMGAFSSEYQNAMFMRFVDGFTENILRGQLINPYEFFENEPELFPYLPVMLAIECVGGILSRFTNVLFYKNILFKLPNLFFDCLCMYYLMKMFSGQRKYITILYFASPIMIYSTYMHGQLDIIPTALLMGAITFLTLPEKRNKKKSVFLLAAALACKSHVIAVLPILFFYIKRREGWTKAIGYVGVALTGAFLCVVPFWGNALLKNVFFNKEQSALTEVSFVYYNNIEIFIPVLVIILIYLHVLSISRINRDLLYSLCGLLFSVFLILVSPMPGWYVWVLPFVTFLFLDTGVEKYLKLVLYIFLNIAYLLYFVFAHQTARVDLYFFQKDMSWLKSNNLVVNNILFTILTAILLYIIYLIYLQGIASNSFYRRKNIPFTIGVSGDSGSGKSTLVATMSTLLGKENLLLIEGDGDHKWERDDAMWKHFTHLSPKANFLYQQAQDLAALRAGQSVMRTDYDHDTGTFTKRKKIRTKPYVLLCGLHALYLPQTRNNLDLKIYMDIDENLRRYWKIQRDTIIRGYNKDDVLSQIETRTPDAEKYIYPQKRYADLQISYFDKNLKDCIVDNYSVNLGLKITVGIEIDLEPLIHIIEGYGLHAEYDYNENLQSQTVIFEGEHLEETKLPISDIAQQVVPQLDEIVVHPLEDADALHTILEIILLILISRKLQEG